jgi:hypothetical protein
MATTTNYSWTTPDDTALVKDGASAIRTLGTSIDTTTKALNPSTTLGDVEYRSSTANTNTRLGIGTTGQVLSVVGGVPAWADVDASSMTLLSTTSLSGATTTISGISGSYKDLVAVIFGVTNATASGIFKMRPNGATTNCAGATLRINTWITNGNEEVWLTPNDSGSGQAILRTSANNAFYLHIGNYASTTSFKPIQSYGHFADVGLSPRLGTTYVGGYGETTAITSLVFLNSGGNLSAGTVLLYGVK